MQTKDGLLVALESLLENEITVGVFLNEPNGANVVMADLDEPKFYSRATARRSDWTINEKDVSAAPTKEMTVKFGGNAGMVLGYFCCARDRVLDYTMFPDPIPVRTKGDMIHFTPRIRMHP